VVEAGLEIIQWIFKGHERAINKEMSVP